METYIVMVLKMIFLTGAITYGFSNICKFALMMLHRRGSVSTFQTFAMGIGIAGFIVLQFCM